MARLHYIGNGSFIPHIPSRDLSAEEVKRFGKERLLGSKLYEEFKPSKPRRVKVVKEPEPAIVPDEAEIEIVEED